MLGPPSTLTTGFVWPRGRPSTMKADPSRSSHKTLFVEPSTRGLDPATSRVAKMNATAAPDTLEAHGTGQGVPFVCDQPLCAHIGGASSVTTVPAQPPASACAIELVGVGVTAAGDRSHPETTSRSNATTVRADSPLSPGTIPLHQAAPDSSAPVTWFR